MNASYIAEDLRDREDGLVWRIEWGKGWIYVYLLLEFQSTVDKFMSVRLLAYIGFLMASESIAPGISFSSTLPRSGPAASLYSFSRFSTVSATPYDNFIRRTAESSLREETTSGSELGRMRLYFSGEWDQTQLHAVVGQVGAWWDRRLMRVYQE